MKDVDWLERNEHLHSHIACPAMRTKGLKEPCISVSHKWLAANNDHCVQAIGQMKSELAEEKMQRQALCQAKRELEEALTHANSMMADQTQALASAQKAHVDAQASCQVSALSQWEFCHFLACVSAGPCIATVAACQHTSFCIAHSLWLHQAQVSSTCNAPPPASQSDSWAVLQCCSADMLLGTAHCATIAGLD